MYFYHFCFFIFVQIIGESLPISSSAHVQLLSALTNTLLPEWYYYMLHGPTIAIVLIFFRKDWLTTPIRYFNYTVFKRYFLRYALLLRKLMILGICAELPTVCLYFLVKYFSREDLYFLLVPFGLTVTALLLYSLRFVASTQIDSKTTPSLSDAFYIGCAQALSLMPGISRMASTYTVARWRGIVPTKAFRFSCFIQLPLIIAGFLKGAYEYATLYNTQEYIREYMQACFSSQSLMCIIVAIAISYAALYSTWLLVKQEKLWYYVYYLIVPITISILHILYS